MISVERHIGDQLMLTVRQGVMAYVTSEFEKYRMVICESPAEMYLQNSHENNLRKVGVILQTDRQMIRRQLKMGKKLGVLKQYVTSEDENKIRNCRLFNIHL